MIDKLTVGFEPKFRSKLQREYENWSRDIQYHCSQGQRFSGIEANHALLVAALSVYNRRVVQILLGASRFQRSLARKGVPSIKIGNSSMSSGTTKGVEDSVRGFYALVERLGIRTNLLYVDSAYDMLLRLDRENSSGVDDVE